MPRAIFSLLLACLAAGAVAAAELPAPWKAQEEFWGAPGWLQDGVWAIGFPRSDLNVMVEGVPLESDLGLTSRLWFKPLTRGLEVRGRLVLLDQECRRVEERLLRDGFRVEGFGNFLLGEAPAVKQLEFSGKGLASVLNPELREVLRLTGTHPVPVSFPTPGPGAADGWEALQTELGLRGWVQGRVLWILSPPFTPVSDPAPGYCSLRLQRDGPTLWVVGENWLAPSQSRGLLALLGRARLTLTAEETAGDAVRVRWWGRGQQEDLAPVLSRVLALGAAAQGPTPTPAASPDPEGF
ncbi:MAG TPA: DUF1259 domain-containing protein [bacterium]|nr:DUF1259 domain-containing protein [bacterium]